MKINMKMVKLSKMYDYNFTLKKNLVFNYLCLTQNSLSFNMLSVSLLTQFSYFHIEAVLDI